MKTIENNAIKLGHELISVIFLIFPVIFQQNKKQIFTKKTKSIFDRMIKKD